MSTESEWSESDLQIFLKYLLNSTVAIAGTYRHTRGNAQQERAYAYSGCLVASRDHWHILTAGHAIKDHIRDISSDGVEVTGRVLADCFGASANHIDPLPFDPVDRVDHAHYVEGDLDYALFTLTSTEREALQKNGLKALPFRSEPLSVTAFERYFIVGFPESSTEAVPTDGKACVNLQPVCIPVVPNSNCETANGRLAFTIIDQGNLESIVGLSGGPVFGINRHDDQLLVYLVAIQSSWDKNKTAFACKIEDVFNHYRQHQDKNPDYK